MIDDARVFTWAKSGSRRQEVERLGLGGGNFLATLGLFSVLNFLSKTYYLLHDDAERWTKEEVERVRKAIKKYPEARGAVAPFVGSPKISEKECFVRFALALDFPLFAAGRELTTKEERQCYEDIWNYYRDKLAHMAMPNSAVVAIHFEQHRQYEGVDGVANLLDGNTDPAFVRQGDRYVVYPDLFARDIKKWVEWLNYRIQDPRIVRVERVLETLNWIKTV